MKYVKMLGLLAVAAAALMAFAGTASAQLTSPKGTPFTGTITGTSTDSHLTGSVTIACKHSVVSGSISKGATTGAISTLDFTGCEPDTVVVLKKGHLTIDRVAANHGTVTSTGAEVTVLTHRTIFGFPVTTHCIYATNNTHIGTFTGSPNDTSHATIDINGSIPRIATDGTCGEDPAIWTGTYTITSPKPLYLS